jgi:hypothetical protein
MVAEHVEEIELTEKKPRETLSSLFYNNLVLRELIHGLKIITLIPSKGNTPNDQRTSH